MICTLKKFLLLFLIENLQLSLFYHALCGNLVSILYLNMRYDEQIILKLCLMKLNTMYSHCLISICSNNYKDCNIIPLFVLIKVADLKLYIIFNNTNHF